MRMHGVRFVSKSAGRGRKRPPRLVTLACWNGRWHTKVPWDELATEIIGDFADGQKLRDEFEQLIKGGRF